jgi:hypothetical protein
MNSYQHISGCKVISIASAHPAGAPPSHSLLAQVRGQHAMNLAELVQSIRADRELCYLVTEAACREFGGPCLSVEDAVVLLGRQRLGALLSSPAQRGRSVRPLRRVLHRNRIAPAANLHPPKTFQGEQL